MTTHLYTFGGPPLSEQCAYAVAKMEQYGVILDRMTPTEAGRLGDLGVPNQRSVGVLTVRHTSRMVYQAPQPDSAASERKKDER